VPVPWIVQSERLEIMYHSIHYLTRSGASLVDPGRSSPPGAGRRGRSPPGRPRTITRWCSTATPGRAARQPPEHHQRPARGVPLDGTDGAIRGTLGLL
jgi:hypothetical protein